MPLDTRELHDTYIGSFYESLDCPRALTCYLLYKYNEHEQLVKLDYDPLVYSNWSTARDALAATKFLSKATFLKTKIDKKNVALDGFFKSEQDCSDANFRITRNTFSNPYSLSVLANMRVKIARILGQFNPVEFIDGCNWGPGASTLLKRRDASYPKKFDVERQITPRAYHFVKDWFQLAYPNWEMKFEVVHSSKLVTVAKNAKTDRVIAIEPGLNLWFQKGIGSMIRSRLKAIGIDLNDQRHNQRLARVASLFNELATVDFSAASDTIALELIRYLLPEKWFNVLYAFRVDTTALDGNTTSLSKFSSMGNGFTFELESLVFYALASSVCYQLDIEDPVISVFGDDVILPSSAFDLFRDCSKDFGFTVNVNKSYSYGPFRESCGSYYFQGRNVKPIFQKEPLNGKSSTLKAANNVRRLAHSRNSYGCDHSLRRCWSLLARSLGTDVPKIGDGYGDLGLVVNPDERDKDPSIKRAKHGFEGFRTRVWALLACQKEFDTPGLLLSKLKAIEKLRGFNPFNIADSGDGGNSVPMNGRFKYTRISMLIPTWPDLGPWC